MSTKNKYIIKSVEQEKLEKEIRAFHKANRFSTTNPNAHRPDWVPGVALQDSNHNVGMMGKLN